MTVLVALERLEPLDDVVVVPAGGDADRRVDALAATRERVTVRDLAIGASRQSANDAATALAFHAGHGSLSASLRG